MCVQHPFDRGIPTQSNSAVLPSRWSFCSEMVGDPPPWCMCWVFPQVTVEVYFFDAKTGTVRTFSCAVGSNYLYPKPTRLITQTTLGIYDLQTRWHQAADLRNAAAKLRLRHSSWISFPNSLPLPTFLRAIIEHSNIQMFIDFYICTAVCLGMTLDQNALHKMLWRSPSPSNCREQGKIRSQ